MFEGQTLYEAVVDEENRLRTEGNAGVVEALGRIYQEKTTEGILEEICADMYAGMSRRQYRAARDANLPQYTQKAWQVVRERTGARRRREQTQCHKGGGRR